MLTTSRLSTFFIPLPGKSLQRLYAVASKNDFDTKIVGFEQNKNAYRNHNPNRLPSFPDTVTYLSEDEKKKMYRELKGVVNEMASLSYTQGAIRGNERTKEMMEYTLPWSPPCAVQALMANKYYVNLRRETKKMSSDEEDHERLSFKLAWALEMLARPALMLDDVIDGSEHRQGLPCWHTVPEVGLHAVNDLVLLTYGGNHILNKYFGHKEYYPYLMKHVCRIFLKTEIGENGLHLMVRETVQVNRSLTSP